MEQAGQGIIEGLIRFATVRLHGAADLVGTGFFVAHR